MAERNADLTGRPPMGGASNAAAGRNSAAAIVVAAAAVAFLGTCYVIERAGFAELPGELTDYLAGLVLTTLIIGIVSRIRGQAIDG